MISDVLFAAVATIKQYQRDMPDTYGDPETRALINALVQNMDEVREILDTPDGFDDWLVDMTAVADEGEILLAEAWKNTPQPIREYLTATDPATWEALKTRAAASPRNRNGQANNTTC